MALLFGLPIAWLVERTTVAGKTIDICTYDALNGSLLQIHRELEEAAFVAGLSNARTAWRVLFPLIRSTWFSVWIWSALLVYHELTAAVFLAVHDNYTLPAAVWSCWYGGNINKASAVTLLMT